jgi:hypothetical protein
MRAISVVFPALALSFTWCVVGVTGQQLGDNATIIVRTGTITNLRQTLVVKSQPKAPTKVGNCAPGEVRFHDALLEDRAAPTRGEGSAGDSKAATSSVPAEVAITFPGAAGFKELKPGWRLGSWRSGGKCGPGYDVYVAHIIAIE